MSHSSILYERDDVTVKIKRLRAECIACMIKKYIYAYPDNASEDEKLEYVRRFLAIMQGADESLSAPVLLDEVDKLLWEMFKINRDFTEAKKYFNNVMLAQAPSIRKDIEASDEPLLSAIKYSMTGNYIDFGTVKKVDESELQRLLTESYKHPVSPEVYAALKNDLTEAKEIVFLTDNCGEVVIDKLLMEQIKKLNPDAKLTAIVRGGDVLNDATMTDAKQIDLMSVADVTDNGNNIAGTYMDKLSDGARSLIESADVIMAKGQANFETLRKCGLNIYYIFMCKCNLFARQFGVEKYTGILVNDKDCK